MGFFDSIKKWFSSETAELKETASQAKSRMEAEMNRREAELRATPEQKLEQIQSEIADDPFSEVRNKIEGQQAHADAVDDLSQVREGSAADSVDETTTAADQPEPPIEP